MLFSEAVLSGPPEDIHMRKKLLLVLVFCTMLLAATLSKASGHPLAVFNSAIMAANLFVFAPLLARSTRVPARSTANSFLLAVLVTVLALDWYQAANLQPRAWSGAVLVLDGALVFKLEWLQNVALTATAVWLVVATAEMSIGFGLFNVMRHSDNTAWVCDCDEPPCAGSIFNNLVSLGGITIVLVSDFSITRGFSQEMNRQVALVRASVAAAGEVSAHLAEYNTGLAKAVLDQRGGALPGELLQSLQSLLSNLEKYRVYLPDALLSQECSDEGLCETVTVSSPGGSSGDAAVCIVFTDIQASTALWEARPQAMYDSLLMHNTLIRRVAAACEGYEVKTIGDAFMYAFGSALDACDFAGMTQIGLLSLPWPEDLLRDGLCEEVLGADGQPLWRGLRVRVGMNWGEARRERNPVTMRTDFFGCTVNAASRIESALGHGGLTGLTDAVLDELSESDFQSLDVVVHQLPPRELKGIAGTTVIKVMLPQRLGQRADVLAGDGAGAVRVISSPASAQRRPFKLPQACREEPAGRARTNSSSTASSCRSAHPATRLGFRQSKISVATVRASTGRSDDLVSSNLALVERAADITYGTLLTVVSFSYVVVWNSPARPCDSHASQCGRFFILQAAHTQLHGGAASGPAMIGNVAGARKRFSTVVSTSVEVSMALAEEACLCGDRALVIDQVAACLRADGAAHRAQLWDVGQAELCTVWEVQQAEGEAADKWGNLLTTSDAAHQPGDDAARREDHLDELLAALVRTGTTSGISPQDSAAVRHLLARAERGAVRKRSVPVTTVRVDFLT